MANASKKKGDRGERELVTAIQELLTEVYGARGYVAPTMKRTGYQQSDKGGCDVVGLDWLALEIKRGENLHLDAWWAQAKTQARPGQVPVLAYRQNFKQWRFRLVGLLQVSEGRALRMLADVNAATFFQWVKLRCESDMDRVEQSIVRRFPI